MGNYLTLLNAQGPPPLTQTFTSDFKLKDNREYINSPTFIQELNRLLLKHHGNEGHGNEERWPKYKIDADFHRPVTKNGIFKIIREGSENYIHSDAPVRMKLYDHDVAFRIEFHETEMASIEARINSAYEVEAIQKENGINGSFRIGCRNAYRLLENIFEANKQLHLKALADPTQRLKIVTVSARSLPFDIEENNDPFTMLRVENIQTRPISNALITLNRLHFPEIDLAESQLSYIVYRNPL